MMDTNVKVELKNSSTSLTCVLFNEHSENFPFDVTQCCEQFQEEKEFEDKLAEYRTDREYLAFVAGFEQGQKYK